MTPLQQKRHRELETTIQRTHEQRDVAITKLVRIDGRLKDLQRTKARLEKAMAKFISPVPVSVAEGKLLPEAKPEPVPAFDDGIPDLLKRTKEADARDAAAATAIKAEQAERKKLKATIRKEEHAAKASGDTKRMPLTGREAVNYLRTGSRT